MHEDKGQGREEKWDVTGRLIVWKQCVVFKTSDAVNEDKDEAKSRGTSRFFYRLRAPLEGV